MFQKQNLGDRFPSREMSAFGDKTTKIVHFKQKNKALIQFWGVGEAWVKKLSLGTRARASTSLVLTRSQGSWPGSCAPYFIELFNVAMRVGS